MHHKTSKFFVCNGTPCIFKYCLCNIFTKLYHKNCEKNSPYSIMTQNLIQFIDVIILIIPNIDCKIDYPLFMDFQ